MATPTRAPISPGVIASSKQSSATYSQYPTAVRADSPVAFWQLAEASGTTALDSSGNSHNGTYSGTVSLAQAGALGTGETAALFSGGNVDLGTLTAIEFTSNFTFECIIKTTYGSLAVIFGAYDPSSPNKGWGVGYRVNAPGAMDLWDGSTWQTLSSDTVNDGNWHHIAISVSGTTATWYKDGVNKGTTTLSATNRTGQGKTKYIGDAAVSTTPITATIAQLALYNTALSSGRVSAHYALAGGTSTAPTGTVGITASPSSFTVRTDGGFYVGLKFNFSTTKTIKAIGVWKIGIRNDTVTMKLRNITTSTTIDTVSLDFSQWAVDGWAYVTLPTPRSCANTDTFAIGWNAVAGPRWYDTNIVTPSADVANLNSCYSTDGGATWTPAGSNQSYGPVSFIYT